MEQRYSKSLAVSRNAYRDGKNLVLQPHSSLPDVCIACGGPACGNSLHKALPELTHWWYLLPPGLDIISQLMFGKRYLFDFPFCPNCPPDRFRVSAVRLDKYLAVFRGASESLLDSLPGLPPDVAEEKNRTWFQRKFRWLYS
jgi:hypothetical protein